MRFFTLIIVKNTLKIDKNETKISIFQEKTQKSRET